MRGSMAALAASAAVAGLSLAGCASSSSPAAAGGPAADRSIMLAAYTHTVGQKTAQISLTETVATNGAAASSGAGAGMSESPAVVGGSAGSSATIIANGGVDFSRPAADLTMQVQGQQLEIREIASTIYLHLPSALDQQLSGGKPWVSLDLNAVSQAKLGVSLSSLAQTSQADPAQMLSYLQAVSRSGVHKGGTATIHGVQTTEYDATIDLAKLAAMQRTAAARQAMTKLAAQAGTSGYPMQVWVGQDGLVHQMQFAVNGNPNTLTGSASPDTSEATATAVTATIQLYNYGSPVTLAAPPAEQTTDLTKVVTTQAASSSAP